MNDNIQEVIQAIAADIRAIVDALMDDDGVANNAYGIRELRDRNRKDDIVVKVSPATGSVVVNILYDNAIEWDRKPRTGAWSAVSDIKEWASAKGLKTDNATLNLIRRSLWWIGHSGRPLSELLEKEIDRRFEGEWGSRLHEVLIKELVEWVL